MSISEQNEAFLQSLEHDLMKEIAKIDEACNEYANTNEAMVQIAGNQKPAGAQVLATVLVDYLIEKDFLKPGMDRVGIRKSLILDLQRFIMNNTF